LYIYKLRSDEKEPVIFTAKTFTPTNNLFGGKIYFLALPRISEYLYI